MKSDLDFILAVAGSASAGTIATLVLASIFLRRYLTTYVSEKAKNLATKEDITEITHKVEAVKHTYTTLSDELKHQNAVFIEDRKARTQLRLAALEKRLAAHQQAFTLWRQMWSSAHTEEAPKVVQRCQTWWDENCLYLEPGIRQAFADAYWALSIHKTLLNTAPIECDRASALAQIQSNWSKIEAFPNLLMQAFQLPPLSEGEHDALGKKGPQPQQSATSVPAGHVDPPNRA